MFNSDCIINTRLFGFFKDIENHYTLIIDKMKEENKNLREIIESQEEMIRELNKRELDYDVTKETPKDTILTEIMENNELIAKLEKDKKLETYKKDIENKKVLIFRSESFNSEFQITDLIGKIIGKDGFNLREYKSIISDILGGKSYHQENNIRFQKIKSELGEHFILVRIINNTKITDSILSEIRVNIRKKMKENIDLPYNNEYPPILISCPIVLTKEEILNVLNTPECVQKITEFLIRENGTSKDNILGLDFSKIEKNSNTKFPEYKVLLSVKVKYLIYRKEAVSNKNKSVYEQLREKKKTNILKSLKKEVQDVIDNHLLNL